MKIGNALRLQSMLIALVAVGGSSFAAELPVRVDHTRSAFFPPVVKQRYQSCSQDAAIYYVLSYEWNRLRGTPAARLENQLASFFVWRMVNSGRDHGSEVAEGWEIARRMGVPPLSILGEEPDSLDGWMDGYERYHAAMTRRVVDYRFEPLTNAAELEALKRWLAARGSAHDATGGVAAFEQRLRGSRFGRTRCGGTAVEAWGPSGSGHAMTYAGYDDTIAFDRDGDGACTNDKDLNGDGLVDLDDWERGALLAVNSFGTAWGDGGKVWVPYHLIGGQSFRRGRWYAVAEMTAAYRPRWTLKLRFACRDRSQLELCLIDAQGRRQPIFPFLPDGHRMQARQSESPEKYSGFVTGKPRLGALPPRGAGDLRPIEMGFDVSGMLGGDPRSWRVAIGGGGSGTVYAASFLCYENEAEPVGEFPLSKVRARFGEEEVILRHALQSSNER